MHLRSPFLTPVYFIDGESSMTCLVDRNSKTRSMDYNASLSLAFKRAIFSSRMSILKGVSTDSRHGGNSETGRVESWIPLLDALVTLYWGKSESDSVMYLHMSAIYVWQYPALQTSQSCRFSSLSHPPSCFFH